MPVTWIEHNGKKILFADYKGIKDQDELRKQANLTFDMLRRDPAKNILFVCDYSQSSVGSEFMAEVKKKAVDLLKVKSLTSAIVGITGLKMIMFRAYAAVTGSQAKLFATVEEAKDYVSS
jgi:maleate cis-trans isomerase